MNPRQGRKVSGDCGDKDDLPCFGWTKYGSSSNSYTYHRPWALISGPLALPRHVRINKKYVVMCASFVILSDALIGPQFQVTRYIFSNTPSETNDLRDQQLEPMVRKCEGLTALLKCLKPSGAQYVTLHINIGWRKFKICPVWISKWFWPAF
jgi:hypothetical protein